MEGDAAVEATAGSGTTAEDNDEDHAHDDDHDHEESHDHEEGHDHGAGHSDDARSTAESAGASPRLGVTFDGGVLVLDAMTLEVLGDFPADGFLRLNPAGDGRHFLVTEGDAFRVLDAGAWSEPHGDHDHSYTTEPLLTDQSFAGDHPGHVVHHGGRTVLFHDGTGQIDVFDPADLSSTALPHLAEFATPEAHHGVAVVLSDDSLLHTVGNEDSRSGAVVLDASGDEVAASHECPGVHGETVAADEVVVLGCEDGVLLYGDGEFHKVSAPDAYGRSGNLAGSEESPVVLGDYKTDPDADLERPTSVALIDTRSQELTVVDLPASYSFRSLGRGPGGAALVLGTDGTLRSLDPETGEVTAETAVVSEWEEPEDWQAPRPTLRVQGNFGYVTEPATSTLHVVDLTTAEVIDSTTLPVVPNELSSVTG
ncbi:zinc metallochaperone AztD [Ornithinicoccus hortensis]